MPFDALHLLYQRSLHRCAPHTGGEECGGRRTLTEYPPGLLHAGPESCTVTNAGPFGATAWTECSPALMGLKGVDHMVQRCFLQSLAPTTIRSYHSAHIRYINFVHLSISGMDPGIRDMTLLSYVMQEIRRSQAATNTKCPRPRLPITAEIL